ncbi:flavodoxin [Ketobacter sp.]|uniref:flavodoxin n=1 Tax=Ketobacter sp. TaxID=2083498 RepID=UPI000F1955DA|nr:flavodoxin [Ketobacter sp.]RLU00797.1 MAG: flavodoxin [Ketobacter sp.]
MSNGKIGIFFGTETGTTRLIAKKIHKLLGADLADKPVNVNRIQAADLLQYDALILGTPSYGVGDIPGLSAGCLERNWEEFLAQFGQPDLTGKRIAFFGLGAQERYADRFASSLMALYTLFKNLGADMVGDWSTDGYTFEHSASVVEGRFVGLVIDQRTQGMHTEERLRTWVEQVKPLLLETLTSSQAADNLQGATA